MEDRTDSRPSVCFQFQVEKILDVSADGRYQVQWAPAWVSKFYLVGCEHLIQEFLQQQAEISTEVDRSDSLEAIGTVDEAKDDGEHYVHILPAQKAGMLMEQTSKLQSEYCNSSPQQQLEMDAVKLELDHTNYHLPLALDAGNCTRDLESIENDPCDEILSQTLEDIPVEVKEENMTLEDCAWTSVDQLHVSHSTSSRDSDFFNIAYEHDLPPVGSRADLSTWDEGKGDQPSSSQVDGQSSSLQKKALWKKTSGKKRHTCSVCDKTFGRRSNLVRHLKTHSGEKPFKCTQCHKLFTQKYNLIEHMRIHSGDKPFTCDFCGKSFTQSSNLRRHHQLIHSNET